MAYYLGLDGGGTKTRCVLADETTTLSMAMTGGSNIIRLGEAQASESLRSAIHQVCASANISTDRIRAVSIGVAGAGRPEIAAKVRAILAEIIPEISGGNIEVVTDTQIALEAAFGAGPGVIAIAGTGSIVYGRDAAGCTARAGGWGFAISDEGSGQWIGRRAISAILNACDRGQETTLTSMVLHAWKITSIDELVLLANSIPPPDFPRLFPVVLRAADEGDSLAHDLLANAGAELAALAGIVLRRLSASSEAGTVAPLSIAITGSVFRQSSHVRQAFWNALQASFVGIDVRQTIVDPIDGALARARRLGR